MDSHAHDRTTTAEVAVRHRPSPVPHHPAGLSLRSAAAAASPAALLALIEADPIYAGGVVWDRYDAEAAPIGWALANECGTPLAGMLRELWGLEVRRDAIAAEMTAL
jgi:hypothetical protein